ncbi:trypco2 family protein [Yinghuangia soli]|uniref:trypco2 family protein n=1 Tax=Yinghuangia soli TaxID=2908204 RepID=UPI001F218D28|nr:trypco2 family protein [Yinghuangia soli]
MDIELADAVAALRDELLDAAARATAARTAAAGAPDLEFAVGPIEMEFEVELRRDASAKAGFKAWVLSGETSAGIAQTRTHRISVSLTPRARGGGDLLISAEVAPPPPGAAGTDADEDLH